MLISRNATSTLLRLSQSYPAVVVTGPRQAGKSTLTQLAFPEKPYVSLEDLDEREFAQTDPRGFLSCYENGAIIDEVQRCPALLAYLQGVLDKKRKMGLFVLTGSAQLSLVSSITQSLAGRVALLNLLPFSMDELKSANVLPKTLEQTIFQGAYPPIYDRPVEPLDWYADYTRSYLERDVRQILNVQDIGTFQRFLRMCAARVGQLLNLSNLANDCGISHNTAANWINVLEATYIVFRLQPHFENFSKRLIKSPKLYFYDSGLLCSLLGVDQPGQLAYHAHRGAIFESWVVSELLKQAFNLHREPRLHFWRDSNGNEVDVVMEKGTKLIPLEIKSGQTVSGDYFKGLNYFSALAKKRALPGYVIYGGLSGQPREGLTVLPWTEVDALGRLTD